MNENPLHLRDPSDSRIMDAVCDAFDQEWADGRQPNLAEFLDQVPPRNQPALARMLIAIDVEYRFRNQCSVKESDYAIHGGKAVDVAAKEIKVHLKRTQLAKDKSVPTIPGYRIEKTIGEGGMGVVYLAEQTEPVRRKVAIKVIKAGFNSEEIVSRFEAERQALALMDHPNIARIQDAGTTENGNPFFAMEWVDGRPILEYCNSNQLSISERLSLFCKVCDAVQHAHQKGIIHRDLKPTNLLVADGDSGPIPKVIDFGLAKAFEQHVKLTENTLATQFGTVVGSPQYMSPEQATFDPLDLDTRTDVYSLGVILYELLVNSTPLESKSFQQENPLKILESIREVDPPRPSQRLAQLNADSKVAIQRQTHLTRLRQQLKGELDWVVMKAISLDRDRRYETVDAFATDVQRFLKREPVAARPASTWYVFGKFAQKYRTLLATAALFFLLLLSTTVIITRLYVNEKTARAESAQKHARAKFFSAIGFWERNRTGEAIRALHEIDEEHRHVEWHLAQVQFESNSLRYGDIDKDYVFSADVSPDGNYLASAYYQKVIIWDRRSGRILRAFPLPDERAVSVSFHPQKKLLAIGTSRGTIQLINHETGKTVWRGDTFSKKLECVRFGNQGKLLAVALKTRIAKNTSELEQDVVWILDTETMERVTTLVGHQETINSVAFSADDSKLVSGSHDRTVRLWDTSRGIELEKYPLSSFALSVAYSTKGLIASGSADNQLCLWNPAHENRPLVWQRDAHGFEGDSIGGLAFSPEGTFLASGSFDRTVRIWESERGNQVRVLRGHRDEIVSIVFSSQSSHLLTASYDGTLRWWNYELNSESRILRGHTRPVNAIDFSKDSQWILSCAGPNRHDTDEKPDPESPDHTIRLRNLADHSSQIFDVHTASVLDIAFCPADGNGQRFASCSKDGTLRFWNRKQSKPTHTIKGHGGKPIHGLSFHFDGTKLATAGDDGFVRLWDFETGKELAAFPGHASSTVDVAWSHDGQWLASSDTQGNTLVRSAETGEIKWRDTTNQPARLAFTPDDRTLICAGGQMRLWQVATGEPIPLPSHTRLGLYFAAVHSSMDAERMLVGGREGRAWLWDSESQEELLELKISSDEKWNFVYDGKISPNGKLIATGNRDGTVRIWGLPARFEDD